MVLLGRGENVLFLQEVDRRQLDDCAEKLRIDGVLVAEIELEVALADQRVEQTVVTTVGERLYALKGGNDAGLEFADLRQGAGDQVGRGEEDR